ncbi:MAG TPA: TrkA family potassium uptake protein [Dehalococcoidia bacterium]|nr:TrkA family potassium uptake protein [Dehalococcoidia bacterium]
MYIIIVGGGSIGYHLSRELLKEGHEALVLDKDPAKCERFEDDLGSACMHGDGCEVSVLAEAGVSRADVFIAVTNEDEDNLVACQIAKHKFNVPRTIARVSNPKNETIFKKLGVDCTIAVTNLIMKHIEEEIPIHPLAHLLTMMEEGTEIVEFIVGEGSKVIGKKLKDLQLPKDSVLALLIRNGQKPQVPNQDMTFKEKDRIIVFTTLENEFELKALFKPGSAR